MSLAIEAFIDNAHKYCDWVESDVHDLSAVRQLLLSLMAGIPYLIATGSDSGSTESLTHTGYSKWLSDHRRFTDVPFQYYRSIVNPHDLEDESSTTGDICDDFADIYGDLKHGLDAIDCDCGIYAINHWRESYSQHWGCHAANAVMAIDAHIRQNAG